MEDFEVKTETISYRKLRVKIDELVASGVVSSLEDFADPERDVYNDDFPMFEDFLDHSGIAFTEIMYVKYVPSMTEAVINYKVVS